MIVQELDCTYTQPANYRLGPSESEATRTKRAATNTWYSQSQSSDGGRSQMTVNGNDGDRDAIVSEVRRQCLKLRRQRVE